MQTSQNLELICEEYNARHAKNMSELVGKGYDPRKDKPSAAMKKYQPIYKDQSAGVQLLLSRWDDLMKLKQYKRLCRSDAKMKRAILRCQF